MSESCTPLRNGKFDRPAAKHPKLDRNIVLERFAASVATGWFANYPDDAVCEMLTANKSAIAKHVLDMGEALTDEFMRRIEQ